MVQIHPQKPQKYLFYSRFTEKEHCLCSALFLVWAFGGRIRKVALGDSPVDCRNRRGFNLVILVLQQTLCADIQFYPAGGRSGNPEQVLRLTQAYATCFLRKDGAVQISPKPDAKSRPNHRRRLPLSAVLGEEAGGVLGVTWFAVNTHSPAKVTFA